METIKEFSEIFQLRNEEYVKQFSLNSRDLHKEHVNIFLLINCVIFGLSPEFLIDNTRKQKDRQKLKKYLEGKPDGEAAKELGVAKNEFCKWRNRKGLAANKEGSGRVKVGKAKAQRN